MSVKVLRLAAADTCDETKLEEFIARCNQEEDDAFAANLMASMDLAVAPNGDMFCTVKYGIADALRGGQMRGALWSEVKKRVNDLRRERAQSGQRFTTPPVPGPGR